jgi:hypothetical protein
MAERYLSWNPDRRRVWTEHSCFPKGAIKWRDECQWNKHGPLRIYRIHEGGDIITEIPPGEWDDHA